MTCQDFATFIMDYLTGQLPDESRAPFERHLSRCASCQKYLAQYRGTLAAGKLAFGSPEDRIPSDVPEDLIQAVLASRRAS